MVAMPTSKPLTNSELFFQLKVYESKVRNGLETTTNLYLSRLREHPKTLHHKICNTEINVPERFQEISKKINEFRETIVGEFKDMEADVRNWNFAVGKTEAEYTLDVSLKLAIKPKKKQADTYSV